MENCKIIKHKARYVAGGLNQKQGVDFEETYSPTARMVTLRFLVSFAVQRDRKLKQLDVKTAYLNAEVDEEIFVQQPWSAEKRREFGLQIEKKLLYGLKQSGRNWFFTLRGFLTSIGFKGSKSDPCLFLRHRKGDTDFVACWVDDLVYCRRDERIYDEFEGALRKKILVSDVSHLNWFLGMQIKRDANKIEISQESYIEKL